MSNIQLGSQLFINREDDISQIQSWVSGMSQHGLSLIRLFISWDLIERSQGQWNFDQFDAAFAAAQKHDMQIVGTLMSVSPPGWMRSTRGMQDIGDLDDPAFWQAGLHYIETVVSRYASNPALHSWILWNEPSRSLSRENHRTVSAFRQFLRHKYHNDISALNRTYFHQFENFDQICEAQENNNSKLEFVSYTEDIDWLEFTCRALTEKLSEIAVLTKQLDPQHKIHINPHRISQCMSDGGQDIWQQAAICDFIGSSVHPPWHSVRFPKDRMQQSVAMFADMMRSATPDPDDLFWVTELQGGPTIFSAFEPSGPQPEDLRQWIWESAASGAKAVLFWCYNNRDDGFEAGEWALIQDNGAASKRLHAIKQTQLELEEAAALLHHAKPHQGEIGILVSSASWNLGLVEGDGDNTDNPRNRQMASDAVSGAYCLAQDLGFEIRFIHEHELKDITRLALKCLLAPSCTALDEASLDALQVFCEQGGTLIADGLFGWKHPNGRIARHRHRKLEQLFGASVGELYGGSDETATFGAHTLRALLFRIGFSASEHASAYWPDDSPSILQKKHAHGGMGTRVGTLFFQSYFINYTEEYRRIFRELLPHHIIPNAMIPYKNQDLRLRRLQHAEGEICILMNRNQKRDIEIITPQHTLLTSITGEPIKPQKLSLAANEVRIFLLHKQCIESAP